MKYGLRNFTDDNFIDALGNIHNCKLWKILLTSYLVAAINVNLTNTEQVTYTGILYIGSKNIPNKVVFDTGSGWLTVTTK